ncbi:MAG: hypothetical protein ACOYL6_16420 [Bacteriovoracaceae bacterium]
MKLYSQLAFLCLLMSCLQAKSTKRVESESCTLNGQAVSCDLYRGVIENNAEETNGTLEVEMTFKALILNDSFEVLVDKESFKELGQKSCGIKVLKGQKLNFVRIDQDHLQITNSFEDGIFELISTNPEEWEKVIDNTKERVKSTYQLEIGSHSIRAKIICQFY